MGVPERLEFTCQPLNIAAQMGHAVIALIGIIKSHNARVSANSAITWSLSPAARGSQGCR